MVSEERVFSDDELDLSFDASIYLESSNDGSSEYLIQYYKL